MSAVKWIAPAAPRTTSILDRVRFSSEGFLWLFAAVVIGFLGWWKTISVVYLLATVMLAMLLVNGVMARFHARRIRIAAEPLLPIFSGENIVLRVTATNKSRFRSTIVLTEQIAGDIHSTLIGDLRGGTTVPCLSKWLLRKRGLHLAQTRVTSAYPLGLISIVMPAITQQLSVLPALGIINREGLRRWVLRHGSQEDRSPRALRLLTSDQTDVRGIRPYRPGDSIKTIHWRSSARRGELMVREYDALRIASLVLVVEPWLPREAKPEDVANLESALSLAASIAVRWSVEFETRVTVGIAGDPESIRSSNPSDPGMREALASLARVVGRQDFEPLDSAAFEQSLARIVRLVVSSRRHSPYADVLTRATGRRFVAISPLDDLPWYEPPDSGKSER